MSGGVDSSVAAAILVRDGWDVIGCFMRLGSPDEAAGAPVPAEADGGSACGTADAADSGRPAFKPRGNGRAPEHRQGCCSVGDAADARQVAAELDIPLYVCNFRKDFGRIIDYFVGEYAAGRTPNPCVRCNDWLKFGKLHDYARQLGATHVASGHYARIEARIEPGGDESGELRLMRGRDHAKDQSYVLFGIPRAQLAHTLFPIGDFEDKGAVRAEAERLGLPVFDKPDSYEICFVPDNDYAAFAERQRPELRIEGRLLDTAGRDIGRHAGQHRFTIGQRRGLGVALGGGEPAYVVARDAAANTVTVGGPEDLLVAGCQVAEANWLVDPGRFTDWAPALAQYRAHGPTAPCRVRRLPDETAPTPSGRRGRFELVFDSPQRAIAPGQALVLYAADATVLSGGWLRAGRRRSTAPQPRTPSQSLSGCRDS
jgi:tRNA-specific 2-thiouridylase